MKTTLKFFKRAAAALFAALMLLSLVSCKTISDIARELSNIESILEAPSSETPLPTASEQDTAAQTSSEPVSEPTSEPTSEPVSEPTSEPTSEPAIEAPDENGAYYDLENVVRYLNCYHKLPSNFITKKEAQALGWSGGSVDKYKKGAAIGGDYFGNAEKLLPTAKGRKYTECDIDTEGAARGAKRLVYSSDGLYFYTDDHYESFREVIVNDKGEVVFK